MCNTSLRYDNAFFFSQSARILINQSSDLIYLDLFKWNQLPRLAPPSGERYFWPAAMKEEREVNIHSISL